MKKNEVLGTGTTWKNPENLVVSEQAKPGRLCLAWLHLYEAWSGQIHRDRRVVVAGPVRWEAGREGGVTAESTRVP